MIRSKWLIIFIGVLMLAPWGLVGISLAQDKVLQVYGPGGPLGPMEECAQLFSKARGVEVKVTAGPEAKWLDQARQDADLIFGGAEYMLTDFILRHPDLVDQKTRISLYVRPAGILVRKANPKKIRSLYDLTRDGIRILDVNGAGQLGLWEDMASLYGIIPLIQKNIALSVTNSAEAIEKWKTMPELDAWITYESWHYRLEDLTDLVEIPKARKLYRGTPIAITTITKQRDLAQQFIAFLRTDPAHAVFKKWGWN
ncbi:MAG: substrate-binding domain-containing protein [Desulfobaccales bacterium]|nr:substrate-binding domain-containing protein [Desulfobaccales bacterium]